MHREELVVAGLIRRFVPEVGGTYDSVCLDEVNAAFRLLEDRGWFRVVFEDEGRLKGRFVTESKKRLSLVSGFPGLDRTAADSGDGE